MIIGEKMSQVVDPATTVEGLDGRLYEDYYSHYMGRALHAAPTLYVKLYKAVQLRLEQSDDHEQGVVEVYHDHSHRFITAVVQVRGAEVRRTIGEEELATQRKTLQKTTDEIVKEVFSCISI